MQTRKSGHRATIVEASDGTWGRERRREWRCQESWPRQACPRGAMAETR